jgi:hypothetical protein
LLRWKVRGMTTPHDMAPQLQHLLAALSRQGDAHLTEVGTDLQQTAFLLREAIEKLSKSFMGIHESVSAQQVLIASLATNMVLSPGLQASLEALQQQSQTHVDAAITGLQFQDMTSQLIGRIVGHVASLHSLLAAIGDIAAAMPAGGGDAATIAMLDSVNRMLDEKAVVQQGVSRKAVAQTHMESGDIELF